jgi:mono/diheme cytochrome c family protein
MRDPSGHEDDGRGEQVTLLRAAICALMLAASAGAGAQQGAPAASQDGALLPRDSKDAAQFRGGLVYASYCVTCHGINADGNGRAARLYNPRPANLRATDKNDAYIELIVRRGGEALGRSGKMPPWGEELTNEQIHDVVAFIRSFHGQ